MKIIPLVNFPAHVSVPRLIPRIEFIPAAAHRYFSLFQVSLHIPPNKAN